MLSSLTAALLEMEVPLSDVMVISKIEILSTGILPSSFSSIPPISEARENSFSAIPPPQYSWKKFQEALPSKMYWILPD